MTPLEGFISGALILIIIWLVDRLCDMKIDELEKEIRRRLK